MHKRIRRAKKLANLVFSEDKCWVFYFCYFLDQGKTDLEADRLAWRDIQREFPRLRKYRGCRAEPGQ